MNTMSSPTNDSLYELAVDCNEFFRQNHFQRAINDLILWICGIPNPFWHKVDWRGQRPGGATKPLLKAIINRFYKPSPIGRFPYEDRFTEDLWIETSVKELIALTGLPLTQKQWDYARNKLVAAGILRTLTRHCQEDNWFTRFWIKIDFDRLRGILGQMHILRTRMPKSNKKTTKKSGNVIDPTKGVSTSSEIAEAELLPGCDTLPISSLPVSAVEEVKQLPAIAGDSEFQKKKNVPFEELEFKGTAEPDVMAVVRLLTDNFLDAQITNDVVRKVQGLNHWKPDLAMTSTRMQKFFELASYGEILPTWMNHLDLELLLRPGIWATVAKELNCFDFSDAIEAQSLLGDIEGRQRDYKRRDAEAPCPSFEEKGIEVAQMDLAALWAEINNAYWMKQPTWLAWMLYASKLKWVGTTMELIRDKAKQTILKRPVWFSKTDSVLHWSDLLRLTPEEVKDLHEQADAKVRLLRWKVYMGKINGVFEPVEG